MFRNRGQHVVPRDGKWSVLKSGASRTSGSYATQKEAVERARELAKSQGILLTQAAYLDTYLLERCMSMIQN